MNVVHDGASFPAPEGWDVVTPAPDATIVIEPDRADGGFRANLVLTVGDNGDLSFRDWQNGTDVLLRHELVDFLLLDLERLDVDGRPGGRRLAHHTSREGAGLVMEQWFAQVGSTGYTLTATVDALRYPLLAATLDECAAGLTLPDGAGR
ncbi:hypothetical protein [Nocardioides sp. CER19]|uniref:hypothetical protein n=1 Tax=Nocardioides sp. CER19 TaxID=3038538 RepID=UPI002448CC44|nr:hypothetical protein [Nocardioides sp. CER19]MDH2414579.1 hypothetical protein [Nocardioides sp. CER19]